MSNFDFTDDRNYVGFEGGIVVLRRCPKCCRFIKKGEVMVNGLDHVKLTGWICKTHGEVQPHYEWTGDY